MAEIPTVETLRLRLRCHTVDDFAASAAMWADPVVVRYIGGRPFSEEESWSRLLRYAGHWSLMNFGYWVVEEKESGCFVGEVGFADFKRDIQPSLPEAPELGWAFVPKVHGRGYATESVRAAVAWGDSYRKWSRAHCLIHPENLASLRVARKSGFLADGGAFYKGQRIEILARHPPAPAESES